MGRLKRIAGRIERALPGAGRRRIKRRLATYVGPPKRRGPRKGRRS